ETADFKIIEFNKENKRLVISHSRIWEDQRAEARMEEFNNRKKEAKAASSAVKKVKESVEKSTLGDLDVLAQLKEQLEGEESEKKSKKYPRINAFSGCDIVLPGISGEHFFFT